ncbi:MAG TPA: class I SAM-dependent methyltransferase [Streptosporangiaceae bacterium]|jgi:SAM-dependent methyltransferase|nr:class I SAM-dependent methyltransferase [Streptosporangiaceae bacterium]
MPRDTSDQFIYSGDDVLSMLDALLAEESAARWDEFHADRTRAIPFFTDSPDESLAEWLENGLLAPGGITPGRVLELGCGHGRNAAYLAGLGCDVDAVDFSARAIERARERPKPVAGSVTYQCSSIFDAQLTEGSYDLVYDSGCLHHIAPHRRRDYVELVTRALRPGGQYGLVCFRPEGGSGYTDHQVYERASLGGGLGYTADQLRALWDVAPFTVQVLRQMQPQDEQSRRFGADFLWVLLADRA